MLPYLWPGVLTAWMQMYLLYITWMYLSVSLSVVSSSATPRTVAHQAPPSMGFPRQEHWRGLPFPSPDDLPDPGTEPWSPTLQPDSLLFEPQGTPRIYMYFIYIYVTIIKYHICFAEKYLYRLY